MDKFTSVINKEKIENPIIKHKGNYITVLNKDNYEFIVEKDSVVILPYFKDDEYILMRYEDIAAYKHNKKNAPSNFLTLITGGIENNESPESAARRELYEEAGIVLSNLKPLNLEQPLHMTKGNASKYYCCLLELNYNDFIQTRVSGDGSDKEKTAKTVKIPISDLNNLKFNDLITAYMITKLKYKYNI